MPTFPSPNTVCDTDNPILTSQSDIEMWLRLEHKMHLMQCKEKPVFSIVFSVAQSYHICRINMDQVLFTMLVKRSLNLSLYILTIEYLSFLLE